MTMLFYRVSAFDSEIKATLEAAEWRGGVLIPLVDPKSEIGKYLISTTNRRGIDFATGNTLLLIYPDIEVDIIDFLEEICTFFDSFDTDIRKCYPDIAVLYLAPGIKKGVVIKIKVKEGEKGVDIFRRDLYRIIRLINSGTLYQYVLVGGARISNNIELIEQSVVSIEGVVKLLEKNKTLMRDFFKIILGIGGTGNPNQRS